MNNRFLGSFFIGATLFGALACGDSTSDSGGAGGTTASSTSGKTSSSVTTTSGSQSTSASTGTGQGVAPTVKMEITPTTMAAGDTVQATITVTDFVLEKPAGQPNQAGHGHYHIYLDGA